METPKICLTLTGKTIKEDLDTLNKYRDQIDICELRADFLTEEERLHIREFPGLADFPCILTIRRKIDGGKFEEGEASRTVLFAQALSFASDDKNKNFQYVDFEEDFVIPSLQDAALAFGTKIIRSVHDMENPIHNLVERLESLNKTGYEIPKIAFMPHTLDDVKNLFEQAATLKDSNHILVAMGPLGTPSRILSSKLKNFLTYTSPAETNGNLSNLAHMDPVTLNKLYHFHDLNEDTEIFGITGWPLTATSSPALHNAGFEKNNINAVYIPVRAETFKEAFDFANTLGIKGMSVTIPHKEQVPFFSDQINDKVREIGASNTIVNKNGKWFCYNTDCSGFERSLLEFTGLKNLKGKKVAIIGAGGAAKGIAYAINKLKGKACVFNRTLSKAKTLADKFGFEYAPLGFESRDILSKYSDIIIQTTSKGMNSSEPSNESNDPLYYYEFSGNEIIYDIVYVPEETPIMVRGKKAGCRVCNGYDMLKYQGWEQFELFTGKNINGGV